MRWVSRVKGELKDQVERRKEEEEEKEV